MASSASSGSSGENVSHFTGIRVRVVGVGNLRPRFLSLDEVRTQTLVPLVMQTATDIQPFRLANFMTQRAQIELKTTEINERFRINRIVIYSKAVFTGHPG